MASNDNNEHSIFKFAALKTAIANAEVQSVKNLLAGNSLQSLEKDYLIDVAKLNGNQAIIEILEETPEKK